MRLLITGAGFSKAWGLPLTSELANVMQSTIQDIPEDEREETAEHMLLFLAELERVHGKDVDLEKILTKLFDGMDEEYEPGWLQGAEAVWQDLKLDSANLWHPPFIPIADPAYHYYALQWALTAALNWNGWAAPPDGISRIWFGIPQAYARLIEEHGPFDAIITLNYDVLPEYLFPGAVDYGFPDEAVLDVVDHRHYDYQAANGQWVSRAIAEPRLHFPPEVLVLKLHGSVNMVHCPACDKVLLYPRRLPWDREPAEQFAWLDSAAYQCTLHCGELDEIAPSLSPGRLLPLMVPPVEDKEHLPQWSLLGPVQERAVNVASSATSAIVVGASLRESDRALTNVLQALSCPIKLVGGADAETRLQALGLEYETVRPYLDETAGDRENLVHNKRPITWETINSDDQLGAGATTEGMDRTSWLKLPEVEADRTYLVVRMSCWPEPGKPETKPFGTLPTMDVLIDDGDEVRLRVPEELREWVIDRIALACSRARDIPGRVRFYPTDDVLRGHVFGP